MTITNLEKLKDQGWYITEHGYGLISDSGTITELHKIVKRAADADLREIGSGQGDISQGNIVLQIQKIRNVSAPKNNEESRAAPRMLKLSLTDGKNNIQAIEVEHINSISLNTPPGTKLLIKSGSLPICRGILLLKPSHIAHLIGGRVANLIEKWELNKKLALHSRVRSAEEGGPPPWIPFGKKIIKVTEQDKNFKALAEKEKTNKENAEFEDQRKNAIAEAAKQGCKKVFGGGNKQLLDHSVQKIVDQGFTIEQAEYALKVNRNNVDRALKNLQRTDGKHKEPRGKRYEKKSEEISKPSSGKISLFDFLEDKLPLQVVEEPASSQKHSNAQSSENFEQFDSKTDAQNKKGRRNQRGGRAYQAPPRHSEENKQSKRPASNINSHSQYSQYNGSTAQNKPPRFQKSQEIQNYYQQQDFDIKAGYQKQSQQHDYKNPGSSLINGGSARDGVYQKSQQGGKSFGSSRNYNPSEADVKSRQLHTHEASYDRHIRSFPTQADKSYKSQSSRYQEASEKNGFQNSSGFNSQRNKHQYGNNQNAINPVTGTWIWSIGDKCKAKYWEDNRYYNAVVTGVSERTCVVQFKGFENYEEVLQADCIPILEDDQYSQVHGLEQARQDSRYTNRQPRYEQSHGSGNVGGTEYRYGGNGVPSNKTYGKRRAEHRSSQPIYQPPAQRDHNLMPINTHNNPIL